MPDGVVFAVIAVITALGFAYGANLWVRRRAEKARLDLSGIAGRVVFFSDTAGR